MAFPRLNVALDNSASWFDANWQFTHRCARRGLDLLPPSLVTGQVGQSAWIFSLLLLGTSSTWGIEFSRHHLKDANPRYGVYQMPLFCWSMLAALVLVTTPVLAGMLILLALTTSRNY